MAKAIRWLLLLALGLLVGDFRGALVLVGNLLVVLCRGLGVSVLLATTRHLVWVLEHINSRC